MLQATKNASANQWSEKIWIVWSTDVICRYAEAVFCYTTFIAHKEKKKINWNPFGINLKADFPAKL